MDIAVSCQACGLLEFYNTIVDSFPSLHMISLFCADGAVRLVNTTSVIFSNFSGGPAGRLEIYNKTWGTVCATDGFDQTAANVVCRQLGYEKASNYGSVADLG